MSDEIVDAVDAENTNVDEAPVEDAPVEGEDALGDPGKKALNAMKAERNAATARAREAEERAAALEAKLAGREAEYQAEVEARKVTHDAIKRAELKAAAKGKLADPTDAALYINLGDFEVSAAGDVDADALNAAIDDLLARKPHLAATERRRFDGDADAGPKGDPKKAGQITSREELNRMTPEQVVEAEAAGRLDTLLGRG